jgi:hypothetical protein
VNSGRCVLVPRRQVSFRTGQVVLTIVIIFRWCCGSYDGQRFENRSASSRTRRMTGSANFLPSKDRLEFHGFTSVTTPQ